ncbi:MAG: hypothetical protein N3H30_01485 [Candidatus Micrarchaeota archaeon]|nr:hypothetical protein [Candidatus Micrarchaeota archaeon]
MPPIVQITIAGVDPITRYKQKLEVSRKFGADGLKIYSILEKTTSISEIMREAQPISEEKVYRILDFMGRLGLITISGIPEQFSERQVEEGALLEVTAADSLARFRHQKLLFKSFSSAGIKVYELLHKKPATVPEVSAALGIEPKRVQEIFDFMLANQIATNLRAGAPPARKEAVPPKPQEAPVSPPENVAPPELKPPKKEEKLPAPAPEAPALPEVDPSTDYKIAEAPLADKYKMQKDVLDRFGGDGLRVYSILTVHASVGRAAELAGLPVERVNDIMRYMLQAKYITPYVPEPRKEEIAAKEGAVAPISAVEKRLPAEEEWEIKPHVEEETPKEEVKAALKRPEEKMPAKPRPAPTAEEEEIRPHVEELPEKEVRPLPEKEEGPIEIGEEEEEKETIEAQKEEEEKVEEKETIEAQEEEEEEKETIEVQEEEEEEEEEEGRLSEFEELIRQEFGEKGVEAYRLIDGKRTAEQIMNEAGVDEELIIKLFEFLEAKGVIRLERPKQHKVLEEGEAEEEERKPLREAGAITQPLSETIERPRKQIIIRDMVPLDVPIMQKLTLPARMSLEAKLLAKFGAKSLRLLSKIDNESDVVTLSIENGVDLNELDEILYSISNSGGCTFATLSEEDIRRRYGAEALAIYKKYGRDGVILYALIGKMDSIRKMVDFSRVDRKKAVEIILEINGLLGIEGVSRKDLAGELGL